MDKRQLIILVLVVLLAVVIRIIRNKTGKKESGGKGITKGAEKLKNDDSDDYEPYSGK